MLIAQNVGFRVYRRLLAEHSPFFRDLFAIPQPVPAPTIEGCPLVFLAEYAWSFRHFLRALFPTKGHLTYVSPFHFQSFCGTIMAPENIPSGLAGSQTSLALSWPRMFSIYWTSSAPDCQTAHLDSRLSDSQPDKGRHLGFRIL